MRLKFPWPATAWFSPNTSGPGYTPPWPLAVAPHRLCFCCQRCGCRLEVIADHEAGDMAALGQEHGFVVWGSRRLVFGLCARCRRVKP